jgi:cytochrome c553
LAAALAALAAGPAFAADPAAGKQVAQGTCAVCHGLDGIAKVPDAPHLAAENVEYLMRQLKAFKSGERKHEQMSIIAESLSEEDMANTAAWYSSIKIKAEMPQ